MIETAASLDAAFPALADPTRRAILSRLARSEATVMELARPCKLTQPAVSRHVKVLEEAGLVPSRIDGTRRPRRLAREGADIIDGWLTHLRVALDANFNRLDGGLAEMSATTREAEKQ